MRGTNRREERNTGLRTASHLARLLHERDACYVANPRRAWRFDNCKSKRRCDVFVVPRPVQRAVCA